MANVPSKIARRDDLDSSVINAIIDCLLELYGRTSGSNPDPADDSGGGGGAVNPTDPNTPPFTVYVDAGYVCVTTGHHLWFNSLKTTPDVTITTLGKTAGDAWVAAGSATVVYIQRIYNSDGTATATLEYAATDYASVIAGISNTEARKVLATLSDGAVVQQWWTGGDWDELRVS